MSAALGVVVSGAAGRLGSLACSAIEAQADLRLVDRLVRGDDAPSRLSAARADVFVDLSLAAPCRHNAPLAARHGMAPVVGVSGLDDADLELLGAACAESGCPALVVPNFSIGAVLQLEAAARAARHLRCAAIRERHHRHKLDSPSGTARETARRVAAAGGTLPPIHSERRADVTAEQDVLFEGDHERLELRHAVLDRRAYLPGLLLAVRRVRDLSGLHVGLAAVLALD